MLARVVGAARASRCRRPFPRSRTPRRCAASAATSPTCASASSSPRSPTSCAPPSCASSARPPEAGRAGQGARRFPTSERCRARTSTSLPDAVATYGAKGVAWARLNRRRLAVADRQVPRRRAAHAPSSRRPAPKPGGVILFLADRRQGGERLAVAPAAELAGAARDDPGRSNALLWVTEFPLFEYSAGREARRSSVNHPFTAPMDEDIERLEIRPVLGAGQGLRRRSGTASSSAAAASVSIGPTLQARVFTPARHRAPRRRARGSASCSTRSPTARRRTAASRSASTASAMLLAGAELASAT